MLLLINNRRLMGNYVNQRFYNVVVGGVVVVIAVASLALIFML
jgi:Mn2+/Fe2+ NRAMP family transporter